MSVLEVLPPVTAQALTADRLDGIPLHLVPDVPDATLAEAWPDNEPSSLHLLHRSFESRQVAESYPGVRGEEQKSLRLEVRQWLEAQFPSVFAQDETGRIRPGKVEEYSSVATDQEDSMLAALVEYLKTYHADKISKEEVAASEDFLAATFAIQKDVDTGVDLSSGHQSTHAFVVPVRLSTRNPEYSDEIRPLVPAFHYVPDELVPYFMRDLPTFVADEYTGGGYLVVAPITADMLYDLAPQSKGDFLRVARGRVNHAIKTGKTLGAIDFGYGATLPGLMHWGRATADQEVTTTTGHGGTTALMCMMIDQAIERYLPTVSRDKIRLGALGLGAIGLSATQVIAERYPGTINVFDIDAQHMGRLAKTAHQDGHSNRYTIQANELGVIDNSDIIISTAGTTFDLRNPSAPNYLPVSSLEGKVIIDDSEPHSFNPDQVRALGGVVLDVIGRSRGLLVRRLTDFGYGHTLADGRRDAFGCELEVAALNMLRHELEGAGYSPVGVATRLGEYALRGPVTTAHTNRWIELFKRYGVGPAPFQAFGELYAR